MSRKAKITRKTKETSISVAVNLDGKGKYKIKTGIGFLDHMLEQLSKHSLIDLEVKAKGDTHIDLHHTTEDTGIAIGEAIKKAAGNRKGITRYASTMIPMDETLSRVSIDVSNRPYLIWKVNLKVEKLGLKNEIEKLRQENSNLSRENDNLNHKLKQFTPTKLSESSVTSGQLTPRPLPLSNFLILTAITTTFILFLFFLFF